MLYKIISPIFKNILLFLFFLIPLVSIGQISSGGYPLGAGFKSGKTKNSQIISPLTIHLPTLDNDDLFYKYSLKYTKADVFAEPIPLDIDSNNSGSWSKVDGGDLWQLKIVSETAYALVLMFSEYHLPEGAKLFVYNDSRILGAFTADNNKSFGSLLIQPLIGNTAYVECFVPEGEMDELKLKLTEVGHVFKAENENPGASSSYCQTGINDKLGQAFQREKTSVIKIYTRCSDGYVLFTGALLNNTEYDGKPYVLTARHCVIDFEDRYDEYTTQSQIESNVNNSVYVFNYEGNIQPELGLQSISGGSLKATKRKCDFALIELSLLLPQEFQPCYLGWDVRDLDYNYTVGIHHPRGDVKKINECTTPINPDDFEDNISGSIYYTYGQKNHWQVPLWANGCTEGGSSGSPLLSSQHRVIGCLTGGQSRCGNSVNDYYYMFSKAWKAGENSNEQLACWLAPNNTTIEYLEAYTPFVDKEVYFFGYVIVNG